MDDLESVGLIAGIGSLVATLVSLALDVALLAVAIGPVRRHRPDVSGLLATAAIILALTTLCSPVLQMASSLVLARVEGRGSMVAAQAALGLFASIVRATGFAMVIAGVARLASPARHDPREPS